jgi:hypothetical protein
MRSRHAIRTGVPGWLWLAIVTGCGLPSETVSPPVLEAAKAGGPAPVVDATDPNQAPQDTTLDVRVLGANFDDGSTVQFLLDQQPTNKVKTNSTAFVNAGELRANITIALDAVVALYDVEVTALRGRKGIGIEKFGVTQKGNQNVCAAYAALSIVLGDVPGDGLKSDGGGAYVEDPPATEAHINGPTGNLSIWTTGSPRSLTAVTALGNIPIDRVYTNNHNSPCGLALDSLPVGSITTAVLEAEEREGGTGLRTSILRYGKDCSGEFGQVVGPKVAVMRPNATTIVLTGTSGKYCTKGKGQKWTDRGTVGPFQMTISVVP